MGLFDFYKNKKEIDRLIAQNQEIKSDNSRISSELNDVKAELVRNQNEVSLSLEKYLNNKRVNLPKPIQFGSTSTIYGYSGKKDKQPFMGPVYDLSEITRALDVEAYVSISVRKHREQILKEGWFLSGESQETIDYIKRRLFEFSLVTSVSFDENLRELTTNLIQYGTSLWVLVRNEDASTGYTYKWKGKTHQPIAGIFTMNPTTVSVQRDNKGHISKWEQKVNGSIPGSDTSKRYNVEDVILATIDKKSGFVFGTPYILPVLDDVRVLRRIEEVAEIVAQRHAFPWNHWKVGSDEFPAVEFEDGSLEVDLVRNIIASTPPEGGIVTDHRVESKVLGAEGQAIDLVPYLNYYEKRVMAGLRLSPEDLGRSEGSKGGAITASETLQEASRDFQAVISAAITYQLFVPLLLEGGYDVTEDNMVKLEFKLINRAEERARVSHGNDLFTSSAITREEFRKDYLSKKDLTEEEENDTLLGIKHEYEKEIFKNSSSELEKTAQAAKNKTANESRPENQFGKKPAKTRMKANDSFYTQRLFKEWENVSELLSGFVEKVNRPLEADGSDPYDISTREDELTSIIETFVIYFSKDAKALLLPYMQEGSRQASFDTEKEESGINNRTIDRFIKNNVTKELKKFASSLKDQIFTNDNIFGLTSVHPQLALNSIIEDRREELSSFANKHVDLAYRVGYTKTVKAFGYSEITLTPVRDQCCDSCLKSGDREVSLLHKDVPYSTLLHTHSGCKFNISI